MTVFFSGNVEGTPFVAVHDITKEQKKREVTARVLDSVTTLYGSKVPKFDDHGWIVRPLPDDPGLMHTARSTLEHVGRLEILDSVTRDAMVRYLGETSTNTFFEQAEALSPQATFMEVPLPEEQ